MGSDLVNWHSVWKELRNSFHTCEVSVKGININSIFDFWSLWKFRQWFPHQIDSLWSRKLNIFWNTLGPKLYLSSKHLIAQLRKTYACHVIFRPCSLVRFLKTDLTLFPKRYQLIYFANGPEDLAVYNCWCPKCVKIFFKLKKCFHWR